MAANVKLSDTRAEQPNGQIAEENPDLPFSIIRDILLARQEPADEEYRFG